MQHHDVIVHLIGERNKGFYQWGSCIITAEYALCSTGVIRSAKTLAVSFTFLFPPNLLKKKILFVYYYAYFVCVNNSGCPFQPLFSE